MTTISAGADRRLFRDRDRAVLGGPAVVDHLDRHGVEVESTLASLLLGENQGGLLEDLEVLHQPCA